MLGLMLVESISVWQCLKILRLKCWTLSVEPLSSLSSIPRIKIVRRILVPTVLGKDDVTETIWQVEFMMAFVLFLIVLKTAVNSDFDYLSMVCFAN